MCLGCDLYLETNRSPRIVGHVSQWHHDWLQFERVSQPWPVLWKYYDSQPRLLPNESLQKRLAKWDQVKTVLSTILGSWIRLRRHSIG